MTDKITIKHSAQTHKNVPRGREMEYSNKDDFVFQALPWDHNEIGEIETVAVENIDEGPRRKPSKYIQYNNEEGRDHTVFITGTTKDGNSVTVQTVFHPYFLIKLGGDEPGPEWTKEEIEDFIEREIFTEDRYNERTGETKEVLRKYKVLPNLEEEEEKSLDEIKEEKFNQKKYVTYKSAFLGWESLRLKDLNAGFTVDTQKLPDIVPLDFQFLKVHFKTLTAMKACSFMLQSDDLKKRLARSGTQISLYEANLDPYIRLMHLSKCEPSGWIVIPAGTYHFIPKGSDNRQTTSMVEIVLHNWEDMRPPEKYINDMAPFRECSIDLETYSPDDAKFSDAALSTDCILQIASTFSDFGSGRNAIRVLYNLGACDPIDEPDTILKCFESEHDMLLAWAELISNSDPDTVHAYNGWDFDFNYLITRAKFNKCWDQFRTTLGRIKTLPSQHVEQHLSSAAYGDNHWVLLTMSGRIVFDPIVHLQREFKLKSYTLKSTSEYFLSVKLPKNPLSAIEGSKLVTVKHPKHGLAVNKVVHLSDVDLPDTETTEDGKKFYAWNGWNYEDLNETLFIITDVPSPNEYVIEMKTPAKKTDAAGGGGSVKAFETKHDVSFPVMNQAHRDNDGAIMKDVGRYCIQDTMLPQKILDKLCVLPNLIEMSKVTWVPFDYLISRGQQVKVHSQVCKAAHETGYAVPTVVRPKKDENDPDEDGAEEDEGYVGGAVLEPHVGFYDQPISVPDFKSLYPTTMIDNNLCYTSHLKNPKYDNIPGVQYNRITVGSKVHTFAMNNDGIVPQILAYLLNTRDARKEMMANSKTDIERMIHNGAQLALKVSANSIYGFMGIPIEKAMLPCMPIAESTTARGRNGTFTTRDFMEDKSGANFEQIKKFDANTDGMPLDWVHLMKNTTKGKCFHLTGAKLLGAYGITLDALKALDGKMYAIPDTKALQVWTTDEFTDITGFSTRAIYNIDLLRVFTKSGLLFDMKYYRCRIVYGDTDSVFAKFDVDHIKPIQCHRVAYCCTVAGYVASRVTRHLRSLNPFKPFNKQWMELQYEKTYRFWLLFSKKRYAGEMTEHDPFHFTDDQKGVASKRRDFCNYVKEIYGRILKSLFDPTPGMTRDQRIGNMLSVVKRAIEDLLNNRVPFDKLVISKLLKDHYKVLKHAQSRASKLCDFNPDNVFVNDLIKFKVGGLDKFKGAMCEGIVSGKESTNLFSGKRKKPLSVRITNTKPIVVGQEIPPIFAPGMTIDLQYGDITEKNASVMMLDKIMDPKTTDKVLEPIKHPHVRLARRMFIRDPATAPKSGARVPYVFCEAKPGVLQHMRSEDPSYAKAHNLVVDPEYYLKKQCEKAWAQILDTTCAGISEKIFNEAYDAYAKKSTKQPDIMSFIAKSHLEKMKVIELTEAKSSNSTAVTAKATATQAAKPISAYFGGSSVHPPATKKAVVKPKVVVPTKEPVKLKAKAPGSSNRAPPPKVAKVATIAKAAPKHFQKVEKKQQEP